MMITHKACQTKPPAREHAGWRTARAWPLLLALFAGPASAALDLAEALQLVQSGEAERAYQMLAAGEDEYSGDPNFDYLLGLAALDSGRPSRAVFALERVLAVEPGHTRARAEIARAYFQLGELDTARNEFDSVRKQGIPPEVADTMRRFLSAIDQSIYGNRKQWRAYVEIGLGYDSNINSATDQRDIAVPALGGLLFTLSDDGVEDGDGFGSIRAGASGSHPLTGQFDVIGGANIAKRENFSDDDFETSSVDAFAGIGYTRGDDAFSVALQGETFLLDNHTFRNAYGVVGGWNRTLDRRTRVSAFVQVFGLDYPGQDNRDAIRYVGGAGVSHVFDVRYTPVVFASAYGGTEDERRSNPAQVGHDLYGLRLGGELRLTPAIGAFGGVNLEFRDYGGEEPAFLKSRDDDRYQVHAGLNYRPAPEWIAAARVSYVNNDSNIVVDDYERVLFAVTLRREFD